MRIEQLTFTRFIAAISIVIFHYGNKSPLFNNNYLGFIFNQANIGVSYFFILSGFVMIIAYHKKVRIEPIDYLKNRFARIYPIYFFAILLVFLLQIKKGEIYFSDMFTNLFLIQSWIPEKVFTFNPPGWSLSVEFIFYLIFPFIYNKFYIKKNRRLVYVSIILFWLISQIIFSLGLIFFENDFTLRRFLKFNPIMHINEFLMGNIAGVYFINNLKMKKKYIDIKVLLLLACVLLALKFPFGLNYNNGLLVIFFTPLIILLSINNGVITKFFKTRICVFLGEISYGIYILQFPVYSIISAYSLQKYFQIQNETLLFFIRFIILLILSSFTYVLIEKPLRNFISNRNKLK